MLCYKRLCCCLLALGAVFCLPTARAYVEAPMSLGSIVAQSTNIMLLQIEKVDKQNNVVYYKKVTDLKGRHPTDTVIHQIGRGGLRPTEWKEVMDWADAGKTAVFFHNGGASETCIGTWWYQCYGNNAQWAHSHGEPFLLRSYAGNTEKLAAAVTAIVAGQEVIVPCMVNGNNEDLHKRRAKIQRVKVSLRLLDYNPKRDFVGWGGEDFRRVAMAGFTHYASLTQLGPDAQCISTVDIDGDGKLDLCLVGGGKIVVLNNGGEALNEISISGAVGVRSAVWADYNGDGLPDLLLATATGAKLYTNLGKNQFRDDSQVLPHEPYSTLTAAAWIDQDGDGKPDILLANGYHGLRLYRNISPQKAPTSDFKVSLGKWSYLGPFDNTGGKGFDATHEVEKGVDLKKSYVGKGGVQASSRTGKFTDGQVNDLLNLFQGNNRLWAAVYLFREIDSTHDVELPVGLGSDDTLSVWLNGEKIHANNTYRGAGPDQDSVVLKLKKGKNQFLMKICQGEGDWGFYFGAHPVTEPGPSLKYFEDVSTQVGLGPNGIASNSKGDTLTICDVNNDGRPDFLYGAGDGMLVMNTPAGFKIRENSGIRYQTGKAGPVFADFDNDGLFDLVVPQKNGVKLFRNTGNGQFVDVTAKSGALAKFAGWATSAAWGDLDNDGHIDLVLGCLRGTNRVFRNKGDGTFEDVTAKLGLQQRIFNTQAVALVDLNNDGMLDFVFNNEGQESCILMGDRAALASKKMPLTVAVEGKGGVMGSTIWVVNQDGKKSAVQQVSGGDGRGGQLSPLGRFAVEPGKHRVVVHFSNGQRRTAWVTIGDAPLRIVIDEKSDLATE